MKQTFTAIILAAGSSTRFGGTLKQFVTLADKPLILHSVDAFLKCDNCSNIIITLSEQNTKNWIEITEKFPQYKDIKTVLGGNTRFQSVKNALKSEINTSFVAIHDSARPLVTLELIENCFNNAISFGSAIPVISPTDTIRKVGKKSSKTLDRSKLRIVQTPQFFKTKELLKAYKSKEKDFFTDDASVMEHCGYDISLCPGSAINNKITFASDILVAETIIKNNIV